MFAYVAIPPCLQLHRIEDSRFKDQKNFLDRESWILNPNRLDPNSFVWALNFESTGWIQEAFSGSWILNPIRLDWRIFFEPWILDLNSRQLRLKKFFRHCVPIEWGIPRKYSLLPQTFPDRPRTDKPRNLHFWEMVGYFFQNVTLLLHFFAVEWFNRCSSCTLKKSYLPNFLEWMQYSLKEYRTYCIK